MRNSHAVYPNPGKLMPTKRTPIFFKYGKKYLKSSCEPGAPWQAITVPWQEPLGAVSWIIILIYKITKWHFGIQWWKCFEKVCIKSYWQIIKLPLFKRLCSSLKLWAAKERRCAHLGVAVDITYSEREHRCETLCADLVWVTISEFSLYILSFCGVPAKHCGDVCEYADICVYLSDSFNL